MLYIPICIGGSFTRCPPGTVGSNCDVGGRADEGVKWAAATRESRIAYGGDLTRPEMARRTPRWRRLGRRTCVGRLPYRKRPCANVISSPALFFLHNPTPLFQAPHSPPTLLCCPSRPPVLAANPIHQFSKNPVLSKVRSLFIPDGLQYNLGLLLLFFQVLRPPCSLPTCCPRSGPYFILNHPTHPPPCRPLQACFGRLLRDPPLRSAQRLMQASPTLPAHT